MSQQSPQAEVSQVKKLSVIWLVPFIAVLIGAWMVYDYVSHKGPEITLYLSTADGIEVGKTAIKSRNVKMGTINSISLSDDYKSIIATAQMTPDANRMLKKDSRFWVVKPRIGTAGVSGLETLLSGAYIELEPGVDKATTNSFTLLETPPVAAQGAEGLRLVLTNPNAGKLSVGDPVLYKGYTVGRVESLSFDIETKLANYQLFIKKPFDKLIHEHSTFWINSGVKMNLSAKGFNMDVGSIESILSGGVSFGVPDSQVDGERVTQPLTHFSLFNDQETAFQSIYNQYVEFVMLFDESVRGLNSGTPVEYRGIRIGSVVKVPLELPKSDNGFSNKRIPVLVRIEPARFFQDGINMGQQEVIDLVDKEIQAGLRGALKTGNLLTGALFIDTDIYLDADPELETDYRGYPVFPTQLTGVGQLQKKIIQLVEKVNNLPIEETVASINKTMNSSNEAFIAFKATNKQLSELLSKSSTQQLPDDMRKLLTELQKTLNGYGPDSQTYQELQETMQQLTPLLKQLNQNPNALVFGKDSVSDPVPAGGKK